jgi:hypothetical protein
LRRLLLFSATSRSVAGCVEENKEREQNSNTSTNKKHQEPTHFARFGKDGFQNSTTLIARQVKDASLVDQNSVFHIAVALAPTNPTSHQLICARDVKDTNETDNHGQQDKKGVVVVIVVFFQPSTTAEVWRKGLVHGVRVGLKGFWLFKRFKM